MRIYLYSTLLLLAGCLTPNVVEQSQTVSFMVIVERDDGEVRFIETTVPSSVSSCGVFNWTPSRRKPNPPTIIDALSNDPNYVIDIMSTRISDLNEYIDEMTTEYQLAYTRYLENCLKD